MCVSDVWSVFREPPLGVPQSEANPKLGRGRVFGVSILNVRPPPFAAASSAPAHGPVLSEVCKHCNATGFLSLAEAGSGTAIFFAAGRATSSAHAAVAGWARALFFRKQRTFVYRISFWLPADAGTNIETLRSVYDPSRCASLSAHVSNRLDTGKPGW